MKQFLKIFSFEFKSYLKNKTFVGITLFFVIASAVLMFAPSVMDMVQGNEAEATDPGQMMEDILSISFF